MADERDELSDAELEFSWRQASDEGEGERRNIGAQARDRKIRKLIEALRRERARHGGLR